MTGKIIKSDSFSSSKDYVMKTANKYNDDRHVVEFTSSRNTDFGDEYSAELDVKNQNLANNKDASKYEAVHIVVSASRINSKRKGA